MISRAEIKTAVIDPTTEALRRARTNAGDLANLVTSGRNPFDDQTLCLFHTARLIGGRLLRVGQDRLSMPTTTETAADVRIFELARYIKNPPIPLGSREARSEAIWSATKFGDIPKSLTKVLAQGDISDSGAAALVEIMGVSPQLLSPMSLPSIIKIACSDKIDGKISAELLRLCAERYKGIFNTTSQLQTLGMAEDLVKTTTELLTSDLHRDRRFALGIFGAQVLGEIPWKSKANQLFQVGPRNYATPDLIQEARAIIPKETCRALGEKIEAQDNLDMAMIAQGLIKLKALCEVKNLGQTFAGYLNPHSQATNLQGKGAKTFLDAALTSPHTGISDLTKEILFCLITGAKTPAQSRGLLAVWEDGYIKKQVETWMQARAKKARSEVTLQGGMLDPNTILSTHPGVERLAEKDRSIHEMCFRWRMSVNPNFDLYAPGTSDQL